MAEAMEEMVGSVEIQGKETPLAHRNQTMTPGSTNGNLPWP